VIQNTFVAARKLNATNILMGIDGKRLDKNNKMGISLHVFYDAIIFMASIFNYKINEVCFGNQETMRSPRHDD
jgi:hypothetical protein